MTPPHLHCGQSHHPQELSLLMATPYQDSQCDQRYTPLPRFAPRSKSWSQTGLAAQAQSTLPSLITQDRGQECRETLEHYTIS
jgi:hypothetical protein